MNEKFSKRIEFIKKATIKNIGAVELKKYNKQYSGA
jgi:hypothetical protein